MKDVLTLQGVGFFILFVVPGLISMTVYRLLIPAPAAQWADAIVQSLFYSSLKIRRGGYQPLQEGYRPNITERGYSADMVGNTDLPKAPEGGTGQSLPVRGEKK